MDVLGLPQAKMSFMYVSYYSDLGYKGRRKWELGSIQLSHTEGKHRHFAPEDIHEPRNRCDWLPRHKQRRFAGIIKLVNYL